MKKNIAHNVLRIKEGGIDTAYSKDCRSLPLSFNTVLLAALALEFKNLKFLFFRAMAN